MEFTAVVSATARKHINQPLQHTYFASFLSHQGLADPETLGLEEGEDHAAPEENDVTLLDQRLDHRNLQQQQQLKAKQ